MEKYLVEYVYDGNRYSVIVEAENICDAVKRVSEANGQLSFNSFWLVILLIHQE